MSVVGGAGSLKWLGVLWVDKGLLLGGRVGVGVLRVELSRCGCVVLESGGSLC